MSKPKLGSGKRFSNLENSLAHRKGVTDPGALAAHIGMEKYCEKKMHQLAEHNRKAHKG